MGEMETYWRINAGSTTASFVWDAFKAYSRGQYQTIIAEVRQGPSKELTGLEAETARKEALYVRSQDPQSYAQLQSLSREVLLLRTTLMLTQKKLLHQTQRIFEEGEKTGHLLAWLSKEQSGGMTIGQIQDSDGSSFSTRRRLTVS